MAKYLVLIYGSEQEWDAQTPEELSAKEAGHIAFSRAAGAGRLSGEELESARSATTLRASGRDEWAACSPRPTGSRETSASPRSAPGTRSSEPSSGGRSTAYPSGPAAG